MTSTHNSRPGGAPPAPPESAQDSAARQHAPRAPLAGALGRVRKVWIDMDSPVTGRLIPGSVPVAIAAGLVVLVVAAFVVPTGLNLAYSDAQSHLTIARRLFDIRTDAGLVQLGTVWLPVPHLLMAPLIIPLWAWHTGWGAALLGCVCLAVTAAGVYRTVARWGALRTGRLAAVAIVTLNPTMLYLCTTALTEPVLIAALAMCLAGLSNVATRSRLSSPGEIAIFCGGPAGLAALSRYEGWAMCLAGAAFLTVVVFRRTHGGFGKTFASLIGFAAPPAAALGWWIGFNWVVFHNPLEFFSGAYSANAQQEEIVASGGSTKGDLATTIATLGESVTTSVGWACVAIAALGLIAGLVMHRGRRLNWAVFALPAASSPLFLLVALYTGQAIIWNHADGADYIWNNRFGMSTILIAAVCAAPAVEAIPRAVGYWRDAARRGTRSDVAVNGAGPSRAVKVAGVAVLSALVAVLALQGGWTMAAPAQRSLVMAEAAVSWANSAPSRQAAEWLHAHYEGGSILMDETQSTNAILPDIGIPLRDYYIRANDTLFATALQDPSHYAEWVWASTGSSDVVTKVTTTSDFKANYTVAFSNDTITIYRRAQS